MTLLTLASRQIWPQVLSVLQKRPNRLVLLHSGEPAESMRPATRLKHYLESVNLIAQGAIILHPVPHDDFSGTRDAIATIAEQLELDGSNCCLNLTGGNKLMAMGASEWCRLADIPSFYLERDFRVFSFEARGGNLLPKGEFKLDAHLANDLEPLPLLVCQLDAAEIVNPGQRLTLNDRGTKSPEKEFPSLLERGFKFETFLTSDAVDTEQRQGDGLEFAVAFALLKLGVPVVQRGIRLSPRGSSPAKREEGELDLIFNWAGKLWVVDCKDRRDATSRIDALRNEILTQSSITPRLEYLLEDLTNELRERDLKPLKEDLQVLGEVAGLAGKVLCVRREPPAPQAAEYARSRNVPVILKNRLMQDLRAILYPSGAAGLNTLQTRAAARLATAPLT